MILKNSSYEIKENTVSLFVDVEINGMVQRIKYKMFIFKELVEDCLNREDKCLFDLITDEDMSLELSDENYELITKGLMSIPCTVVNLTKQEPNIYLK